jgi:hypothetical protein
MLNDLCMSASICFECYPTKAIVTIIFYAVIVFVAGVLLSERVKALVKKVFKKKK